MMMFQAAASTGQHGVDSTPWVTGTAYGGNCLFFLSLFISCRFADQGRLGSVGETALH